MRIIFNNLEHQIEFERNGFIILDSLPSEMITAIEKEYEELKPDDLFNPEGQNYHCTFIDKNNNYKKKAFDLFGRYFTQIIDEILIDYKLVIGNFYVKPSGSREFEVHQNWAIVDESKHTSLTLWIPLQDTNPFNGTLEVVPGSNRISSNITCFGIPYFFHEFESSLKENYFKPLILKKGQIVVFDDNLIHYSKQNNSDETRRAIQLVATPIEAQLQIYFPDISDNNRFNVFATNIEFYLNNDLSNFYNFTPNLTLIKSIKNNNRLWSEAEFKKTLGL
jgi:hypothetical protein